jgi:hypothetical protein
MTKKASFIRSAPEGNIHQHVSGLKDGVLLGLGGLAEEAVGPTEPQ